MTSCVSRTPVTLARTPLASTAHCVDGQTRASAQAGTHRRREPAPAIPPNGTIPYVAAITVRDDTTVILKARPQYRSDRPVTTHHMSVVVPQPADNEHFLWAIGIAAHTTTSCSCRPTSGSGRRPNGGISSSCRHRIWRHTRRRATEREKDSLKRTVINRCSQMSSL